MNRFNKVLTVMLIIVTVGAIVAFGFWIFDIVKNKQEEDAIAELEKEFFNQIPDQNVVANTINVPLTNRTENQVTPDPNPQPTENTTQPGGGNGGGNSGGNGGNSNNNSIPLKYKGYDVIGWISIPKINLSYPILSKSSLSSMDIAPGWVYGPTDEPSVNVIGNTVIYGHNYHNGRFFSNNKKLNNGDYIYITSRNGEKVRYVIYNKYETSSVDFDYAIRKTENRREISLATCTDDQVSRLIIWAKEG